MKFPYIKDIATRHVAYVDIDSNVNDALEVMLKFDHRDVIVTDIDSYKLFTVNDIIEMQNLHNDLDIPLSECNLPEVPVIDKDKNVLDTLEYLGQPIEYICVVNKDNSLYGLINHTDITSNIDPDTLMENYRLTDYLKLGRRIMWVKKDLSTLDLFRDMIKKTFDNALIVENRKPIGIFTTKDMLRLIKNKSDLKLPVGEYMTSPVDTINKNSSIREALEFVKRKHFKRVVVVDDDGILAGVITQKELITLTYGKWVSLIKEHQTELAEMNVLLKNKNIEYQIKASTDQLTGLYNRYKFEELFQTINNTMFRKENTMSLILMDIDYFKDINDNYGHNVGDNVLVQVSHILLSTLRENDIVCRWGGEEFVILLPETTLSNAVKVANKLRTYISEYQLNLIGKITASFGVSELQKGDKLEDLISKADKALYLAKNSGRNCVKTEYSTN